MDLNGPNLFLFIIIVLVSSITILSGWFAHIVLHPKTISHEDSLRNETNKGWLDSSGFANLKRSRFTISSRFGYLLHGEYIQTENATKTVILSHGISSNLYGMIRYISLFQEMGFNIVIYDMRRHGASGGKNTTYGYYEKYDLKSLVDWLLKNHDEVTLIGTMGISLGAAVSLQHASIDSRVSFTIAEASFSDFTDQLAYRLKEEYNLPPFPLIPLTGFFCQIISGAKFDQISPIQASRAIQTPVFLIHGKADTYILPEMSQAIFNTLTTTHKGIYFAPRASHSNSLRIDPEEYKRQITNFLAAIEIL